MIEQHSIETYAPEINTGKDNSGGYFAAVRLEDFSAESVAATTVYSRKDFYKVSLITGNASYFLRDQEFRFTGNEWGLIFTNRYDPYRWEVRDGICTGYSCMFTEDFLPLHTHLRPVDLPVFNGKVQSVFHLKEEEKNSFEALFKKMISEQAAAYKHKYDLLFIYVLECIHAAMKLEPATETRRQTAATRLSDGFKNLLSGQYPIVYPHQQIQLRSAQDFAERLAVHPNSLNRALKEVTGRTTSQLINEQMMQEASALLLHSNWSVGQISNSLGFEEATHFTRAFKAHTGKTPSSLR